uniref:Uncharacterized protein n=1 Tax=Coptotermes formosanus TaxID=36987 RepID=R4UM34_COPFO|nr:hypothetical protein [Coptotermes formosanus]
MLSIKCVLLPFTFKGITPVLICLDAGIVPFNLILQVLYTNNAIIHNNFCSIFTI